MSDVTTIEGIIRKKAVENWHKAVDAAFDPAYRMLDSGSVRWAKTNLAVLGDEQKPSCKLEIGYVLDFVIKTAKRDGEQKAGDTAIREFLTKVDTLSNEVEELRNSVSQ